MKKKEKLLIILFINIIVFSITNILFDVKYEQVDDFILYNLYSGLDGTYNIYGIYIYPLLCFLLSIFYRIMPMINWHTIFLLVSQFTCFTIIGYTLIKKNFNNKSIILYTIFVSIAYPILLMLIQYTSVSALLIITSFFLLVDLLENKDYKNRKNKILLFVLFSLGIMIRTQSIIIILPFFFIYFVYNIFRIIKEKNNNKKEKIKTINNKTEEPKKVEDEKTNNQIEGKKDKYNKKNDLLKVIEYYVIYLLIFLFVYISTSIIYNNNEIYSNYMKYNDIRAELSDIVYVDYEKYKEVFDEIGWTKNDHYMFYTFGFGDENIYSKENLEKILNYKIEKDGKYNFSKSFDEIFKSLLSEQIDTYIVITTFFIFLVILNILKNKDNIFTIMIFLVTIGLHALFIFIGRSMQRVILPEYIMRNNIINV